MRGAAAVCLRCPTQATEPNVLKEMIKPPTLLNKAADSLGLRRKVKNKLPTGQTTFTPWRRAGVKYTSNECFVDLNERVDATIGKQGDYVAFIHVSDVVLCNVAERLLMTDAGAARGAGAGQDYVQVQAFGHAGLHAVVYEFAAD